MIVGHYAAGLLPYARHKQAPLWLFLLCANLSEFLWLFLALVGVEPTTPESIFAASFQNLKVDMIYSHNVVPNLVLAAATGVVVQAVWKDKAVSLWCAALVVIHVLCDYVVGFEHQVLGKESMSVGLNTYGTAPYLAILIECAFAVACLVWYGKYNTKSMSPKNMKILYALFIAGILFWLPTAEKSLNQILGLNW